MNAAQTASTESTKYALVYDKEPCTRCGGSGHYSRCSDPQWGTLCFMCGKSGSPGTKLTKDAADSRAKIAAFQSALCDVAAETVKPGDVIVKRGNTRCRLHVLSIDMTIECMSWALDKDGNRFNGARNVNIVCKSMTFCAYVGYKVTLAPTAAQLAEIVAYARTLPGVIVVSK